ncbi:MAG: adenine deaminase [Desulfobacterales bacterium]|nr:adenine deaminase [Desulfobacterales bacterium]
MKIADLIQTARGDHPADLLLTDAKIINVFTGEVQRANIAIKDGCIAGLGDYDSVETLDLNGKFVAPGLIDAHVHIESAMVCASEFARAVIPRGTTAIIADPHEIANVSGIAGIEYMLMASGNLPLNVFFTLPSCVPATLMETSGATLDAEALNPLLNHHRIIALGEMMNFPGVIHADPEVLKKLGLAMAHGKRAEGHCPGLSGRALNAYLAAGISSDHECTDLDEAMEKLRAGMHIMIREGTGAKNLAGLLPVVSAKTAHRIMWCTDDRHPHDICSEGHIDDMIRRAIGYGMDPITAIQIGTINPARYFNLRHIGAIAPGRRADLIVLSDLDRFEVRQVYTAGKLAAQAGRMAYEIKEDPADHMFSTMNVDLSRLDFTIPAKTNPVKVIEVVPGQIVTRRILMNAAIENGFAVSDPSRDVLKLAVVERYKGTGNIGKGFVKGFGLQRGALASSVAHDSHNIIAAGVTDDDMKVAVKALVDSKGGLVVVSDGDIKACLGLPIAGLMSNRPLEAVRRRIDKLTGAAKELGCRLPDPFMTLSFLALPVIPELKLTDKGLFDGGRFEHVPLFSE